MMFINYINTNIFRDPDYHLQWIPFESFGEIKFLDRGGFSSVFSGIWLNKIDQVWCENEKKFIDKPLVVALKSLKNSLFSNQFIFSSINLLISLNILQPKNSLFLDAG